MKKYFILFIFFQFMAVAEAADKAPPGINSTPWPSCNLKIFSAEALLGADGSPADELEFLKLSKEALSQCESDTKDWKDVLAFIKFGRKACIAASDQRSYLFEGACYLKVANAVVWIAGK